MNLKQKLISAPASARLQIIYRICLIGFILMAGITSMTNRLQAQPFQPLKSRTDIFPYFDPSGTGNPYGIALASDGIVAIQQYKSYLSDKPGRAGTAFLVRTPGVSDKVALVTAGHVLRGRLGRDPVVGETVDLNSYIYMKYLGKDSIVGGIHYNRVLQYVQGYLDVGEVKAFHMDEQNHKDYALILIDPRKLPVKTYTQLGYDFSDTWPASERYYTLGHPEYYPQIIFDNLQKLTNLNNAVDLGNPVNSPYATGSGASGSPLITRPANAAAPWSVRAIAVSIYNPFEPTNDPAYNPVEMASHNLIATKMKFLEPAIRQYCWGKQDSASISANQSYKQSIQIDNTANLTPYYTDLLANNLNSLLTSTASIKNQVSIYGGVAVSNMASFFLRFKSIQTLNFPVPNKYPYAPYANFDWIATLVGSIIELHGGFEYDASGNSQLNITAVKAEPTASGSSTTINTNAMPGLLQQWSNDEEAYAVYPNPSSNGVFYLKLPSDTTHHIIVYNMIGKEVYTANCSANPFCFNLTAVARGTYLLAVYRGHNAVPVYQQKIVY